MDLPKDRLGLIVNGRGELLADGWHLEIAPYNVLLYYVCRRETSIQNRQRIVKEFRRRTERNAQIRKELEEKYADRMVGRT